MPEANHLMESLGLSAEEAREFVAEFVAEAREQLADAEPTLLELETRAAETGELDDELVNKAFRAFHSLKGSAAVLGFDHLVAVTHTSESLLDHYRSTKVPPSPEHVSALCSALDFCGAALDAIESDMSDAMVEPLAEPMKAQLDTLLHAAKAAASAVDDTGPDRQGTNSAPVHGSKAEVEAAPDPVPTPPPLTPDQAQAAVAAATALPASPRAERPTARGNIRVDLDKLDLLQNLVGELIIAENMLTHTERMGEDQDDDEAFQKARAQLNRVTRDLQDVAMSVRMVPVGATFQKMIRIVRDVSTRQAKSVMVQLEGECTEIDKTVIEKLADPLVHIVRNSVDHGIETTEERRTAGKDPRAKVELSAMHRGGEVWVCIRDDGKGLDREKILDRARSRGLVVGDGDKLKDSEVWQFIFEPGFSTAAQVTNISGRGVGLDVVRRNVQALRGRIDIHSEPGQGTVFTLRIPLTLAIIEGMLARVGPTRYTVPMLSVRESVAPTVEQICTLPSGAQMIRLRGELVPVLRLDEYYGIAPCDRRPLTDGIVVIVEDGDDLLGLFVDELMGQYQTVIKPLPTLLGRPRGVSGMCLLANGDISLILDIKALANAPIDRRITDADLEAA